MLPTLVLAAGLGTRLDPLTRLVAKPAVPLAGRTLIERILDHLRLHGIRNVVVNLHHRPDTITSIVGDGEHLGLQVRYSWEPEVLGSAGGPRKALRLLDTDRFLIVNGDTLGDAALAPLLGAHQRSGADVTLAVVPNPAPDRYNGIILDEEHTVLGFVPRGQADRSWHFVGLQIVQSTVFRSLVEDAPAETVAGIYLDRLRETPGCLHAQPVTTTFHDVGTPRDYLQAALAAAGSLAGESVLEPGATVDPAARVVRSVVWSNARVEARARLEDCVVAGDVTVPRGLEARHSTLVPATLVGQDDAVEIIDEVAVFPFLPN